MPVYHFRCSNPHCDFSLDTEPWGITQSVDSITTYFAAIIAKIFKH